MAIDIEYYSELSKKPNKSKQDLRDILNAIPQAINEGADIRQLTRMLIMVSIDYLLTYDDELVDELLKMTHLLESCATTAAERGNIQYALLNIYLRLGFVPKVIESSLAVVSNEACTSLQKFMAYGQLATEALNCHLYDKSNEFGQRALEEIDESAESEIITETQRNYYKFNVYSNLRLSYPFSSKKDESDKIERIFSEYVEKYPDDNVIAGIALSGKIDMLTCDILREGINENVIEEYTKTIHLFIDKSKQSRDYFHNVSDDVKVLVMMRDAGYYEKCMEICVAFTRNPDCFVGETQGIYELILELYKLDNNLLTVEEYDEYREQCFNLMRNSYHDNRRMLMHLADEEFRIHDVDSAYITMKAQYETDPLTVCYNRPSFEMNAESFMKSHPEGALCFIDLDGLKHTNDHFGHKAGDFLLKTFVSVFKDSIDAELERLYRYAGDEFVLVSSRSSSDTDTLVEQIGEKLKTSHIFEGNDIRIEFSHGVASFAEGKHTAGADSDIAKVINLADGRMYECKRKHKERNKEFVRG